MSKGDILTDHNLRWARLTANTLPITQFWIQYAVKCWMTHVRKLKTVADTQIIFDQICAAIADLANEDECHSKLRDLIEVLRELSVHAHYPLPEHINCFYRCGNPGELSMFFSNRTNSSWYFAIHIRPWMKHSLEVEWHVGDCDENIMLDLPAVAKAQVLERPDAVVLQPIKNFLRTLCSELGLDVSAIPEQGFNAHLNAKIALKQFLQSKADLLMKAAEQDGFSTPGRLSL